MISILKYKTVKGSGQAEIVEKKSRFIANVIPVETREQAVEHIERIKKQYWDARHNVYAYRVNGKEALARCSDDGEPSGTAGMPVLEVLTGEDIKNTLIVVTRYFGGTLLGTGGLVRAYGKAAKEGLLAAGIVERVLYTRVSVTVDYNLSGRVQYEILKNGHILEDTVYTHNVEYKVLCEKPLTDAFIKTVTNAANGQAVIETGNDIYKDRQEE